MNISEIGNKIFYAGVNNRTASVFEELWPIPNGVSYNSYVVAGDKVALIDTVPACYCIKFLHKIAAIIGNRPIDYLIINHMEPDHSGAIQIIRQKYPDIKIVGNSKTADMIAGYYGITDNLLIIKENDTIDLGAGKTLRFFLTPMVHWPETMMTYLESDAFIFTGDAFGCYGALNGGVVDNEMNTDLYIPEMYRYYSNIVAKYGVMVQNALKKTAALKIDYICPTHGPVWHERAAEVVGIVPDDLPAAQIDVLADAAHAVVPARGHGHQRLLAEAGLELHVAIQKEQVFAPRLPRADESPQAGGGVGILQQEAARAMRMRPGKAVVRRAGIDIDDFVCQHAERCADAAHARIQARPLVAADDDDTDQPASLPGRDML